MTDPRAPVGDGASGHGAPVVGLARRFDLGVLGVGAVATVIAGALAGAPAAVAVGAVIAVGAWGVGRSLRRELVAADGLIAAASAEVDAPMDVDGDIGRASRLLHTRLEVSRRAHDRSRRFVDRMLATYDAAPWGVLLIGAEGTIELANRAAVELLGLRGEVLGRTPVAILAPAAVVSAAEAVTAAGGAGVVDPVDFVVGERDLSVSAHRAGDAVLVLVRDVTGERRLDRARSEFVANVSHELRTPIAAILGFTDTLQDTPGLPDDAAPLLRTIQRNARRLRQLFEDLLTLYKVEARHEEPPRSAVELSPLVSHAVGSAVDAARTKGLTFSVDVPADLRVVTNAEALSTIVGSLADNACKYTASGGRVDVAASVVPDGVRIDVRDNGPGIARVHHERIFERFYRVDEGRSRAVGGTGLGLAIVKHLASAAGLRVSLVSEEGKGSTFSVLIPTEPERRRVAVWQA